MHHDEADDLDGLVGDAETVRQVFDTTSSILVAYSGDEHRIVAANAAFRALVGRDHQHMVGQVLRTAVPELAGQQIHEILDEVYATGRGRVAREWCVQVDSDQAGRLREVYLDFTLSPVRDAEDAVVGVRAFATDVTERVVERKAAQARAATAVQHHDQAREVVDALQRQLLPAGLPVLPAVRIASSYLRASRENDAGGDWFDAIPLGDGRVALVVGDVVGHGLAASSTMGQLRAVLEDRLAEEGDVLTALAAADRMAVRTSAAHAATVCVAVLDPGDGALTWCSAGHPPPLVIGATAARYLVPAGAGPLGTGARYVLATDRLEPDEVVLLYSDGIIERPGRHPATATVELSQVGVDTVARLGTDSDALSRVEHVCTRVVELLVRRSGYNDDIALLAAQRVTPAPPLSASWRCEVEAVTASRLSINAWLRSHATAERDVEALAHAVTELVTNALQHSHPDSAEGVVVLRGDLDGNGVVHVSVADDGRWIERARPGSEGFRRDHGLGLALASKFVDRLDIDRGEHGTTVTAHHRLRRQVRLLTAERNDTRSARSADAVPELVLVLDQPHAPGNRIAVHGPLDAATSGHLHTELARRTLGGSHGLVVDLSGVTHLASAAVSVLHRATTGGSVPLRLYAPAGSTAHHVLALAGLPHTTADPHGGSST